LSDHQLLPTEKDTCVLAAFTPVNYTPPYPWYINFTMVRLQGDVVLTIRAPTNWKAEPRQPGETASLRMNREMWRQFVQEVAKANQQFEAADALDAML
jgi:hypothetical protein